MPPSPPTQQMGEKHEAYLAEVLSGTKTRGSGSKWFDQGDVRNNHDEPFAFCADGKSTLGKSIGVTREMLAKIREQAQGERPAIGLRFYGNANLDDVDEDWVAVQGADFEELLPAARAWVELEAAGITSRAELEGLRMKAQAAESLQEKLATAQDNISRLGVALLDAEQKLHEAGAALEARDRELDTLRFAQERPELAVPPEAVGHLPRLPWTVITVAGRQPGLIGEAAGKMVYTDTAGIGHVYDFREVRVDRTMGNRPKVFVDNVRVKDCDVYGPDGKRTARACEDDPSIEEG